MVVSLHLRLAPGCTSSFRRLRPSSLALPLACPDASETDIQSMLSQSPYCFPALLLLQWASNSSFGAVWTIPGLVPDPSALSFCLHRFYGKTQARCLAAEPRPGRMSSSSCRLAISWRVSFIRSVQKLSSWKSQVHVNLQDGILRRGNSNRSEPLKTGLAIK